MKLIQPLIISLLVHLCLLLVAQLLPSKPLGLRAPQPIEVVYQNENPDANSKTIVTDPDVEKLRDALKNLKDTADKLSRVTRRVPQESIVRRTGPTQNRSGQNATPPSSLPEQARRELKQKEVDDSAWRKPPIGGDLPVSTREARPGGVGREARTGVSSLAEFIPEVREGGFTALNTDQFIHYTFYARINEQVRNRWVARIREFLDSAPAAEVNRLARKTQISQVEILLTPEGQFVKAILHGQSESRQLDRSAVIAFQDASPLNNPPEEMVEADGYVHLRYGFYLQFRPRYMASGSK